MRERVEYWQEIASRALLELRTERLSQEPFFGMLDYQPLGTLDVLHLHSSAQRVIRGPLEIARSSEERFFICSNLSGRCILHQGDQETVSRPGDLEIISGNHPTHITFGTDYRRIIIPVPRKMLAPRLVNPERLTMLVVSARSGLGAIASDYLHRLVNQKLPARVAWRASELLLDVLAHTFNSALIDVPANTPSVREAWRDRIRSYVDAHLAEPERLRPAVVAKHFRMSLRYLHALFQEVGEQFHHGVLAQRLERCRAALADPLMRERSITQIAFEWGFKDLSQFGRAFKKAFEKSPRDYRMECMRSWPPPDAS